MISISIGTIATLSCSTAASLVSRRAAMSGWTRRGALGSHENGSFHEQNYFEALGTRHARYKPGEPIPAMNFAQEQGDISTWDTSGVVDMRASFNDSGFSGDVSTWDVSGIKSMSVTPEPELPPTPFDVDTSKWELSLLKDAQDPQAEPPAMELPSSPAP